MKKLAIIGAGDLGQQIANYAISDQHYKSVVYFDDFNFGNEVNGNPILGKIDEVKTYYDAGAFDEILIGIGYKHLKVKAELYQNFKNKVPFGKIIHSTCIIDNSVEIGEATVIFPGCLLDANVEIKPNTLLNVSNSISHDTVIGESCFLSPRVAVAGFVNIGDQCILGINSTIIDNIKIIENSQIGGGSVVIKNIEKSGLYVGNPARFIR